MTTQLYSNGMNYIVGNACDPDTDGDGIDDVLDNCPAISNNNQSDVDGKPLLS
jgi:hypothetical protein